jgi:pre-mRNA-splicing factor ISY1
MFNKWVAGKQELLSGVDRSGRRPNHTMKCDDVSQADKFRTQILREVGRKVMEIQNESLGEHRLRDLNDEINKLLKEKWQWEMRIKELGGPNYIIRGGGIEEGGVTVKPKGFEKLEGAQRHYKYFGAAKNLPGVKELFEREDEDEEGKARKKKRTKTEMLKRADAKYFGFNDDEDEDFLEAERRAEEEIRNDAVENWKAMELLKAADAGVNIDERTGAAMIGKAAINRSNTTYNNALNTTTTNRTTTTTKAKEVAKEVTTTTTTTTPTMAAYVPLPDDADIEALVLAKKKRELLEKYQSAGLSKNEAEAKNLLNKKDF